MAQVIFGQFLVFIRLEQLVALAFGCSPSKLDRYMLHRADSAAAFPAQ